MDKKVTFQYFYGTQADQYSFYRIPKALFQDEYFRCLSSDAKILYGLMLDRMSLSIKNQWFDAENRAYIYFSIEDIMELLNCGRNKAIKSLQELDSETGIGLIEKKRQGFGKTNIIYVKSFVMKEEITKEGQTLSKTESESPFLPREVWCSLSENCARRQSWWPKEILQSEAMWRARMRSRCWQTTLTI